MTPVRRVTTGVGALLALALIMVGLPVTLMRIGAFPSAIPDLAGLWQALIAPDRSGRAVFVVLAVLAWACWAMFTVSVVREVAAAIASRGRRPARPARGLGWSGRPAAVLVGAVVAMIVAAPVATVTAPPVAAAPTPTATATYRGPAAHLVPAAPSPTPDPTPATAPTPDSVTTPTGASASADETATTGTRSYTVVRHDTLWSIAARQLGQPRRWGEIADLNPQLGPDHVLHAGQVLTLPGTDPQTSTTVIVQQGDSLSRIAAEHGHRRWQGVWAANAGRDEPGGDRFTNPNHIEPGWTITIPAASPATPSSAAPPAILAAPPAGTAGQTSPGAAGAAPPPSTASPPDPQPAPQSAAPAPHAESRAGAASPAMPTPETGGPSPTGPEVTSTPEPGQQGRPVAAVAGFFTAGGLVLAASAWVALVIARRQRFRHRLPGRGFAAAAPELAAVERAVSSVGAPAAPNLTRLDEVLRRLAGSDIPHLPLAAVAVTGAQVTVHFTDPVTLPDPWTPAADDPTQVIDPNMPFQEPPSRVAWTFPADAPAAAAGPDPADMTGVGPFPTLVTLGTDGDSTWLLDLERAGGLTLTGDAPAALAVGRAVAAQLALNPWSDGSTITLVGFGHQLVDLNPERLQYATCAQADQVMAAAAAHAASAVRYASHGDGRDLPTIRRDDTEPEAWPPHVLLVDREAAHTTQGLLELIGCHPARTATAVLITGGTSPDVDAAGGVGLAAVVAADGTLTLPQVGLTLTAHRWDEDTADGVARLLRHARDADGAPIPPAGGLDQWAGLADQAGAIRGDLVAPRTTTPVVHEADPDADTCLLPLADEVYLEAAASTAADLQVLAPNVPAQVSDAVHDIDPGLEADLAAWFDPHCARPRLTLLGPLTIRTPDEGGRRRLAYYTEVITYLATRDNGATVEQLADAFSIANGTARKYVHVIRHLLGRDPDTGELYLPDADDSPAGKARGVPTYQIRGILVDADLFRRLRLRGQARGQHGITDLAAALQLVTGEPFSQMRPGGGEWVIDGDRIDHHLTHAITDVAHLVTTHALAAGDLAAARAAVDIARVAAPYEEITRLDAVAIDTAAGDTAAARRALIEDVCNRSDDHGAPPELSERTQLILTQHADWLTRAS